MAGTEGGGQQRQTRRADEVEQDAPEAQGSEDLKERHDKLTEDVDDMLDEIDSVLEENAEEFVRQYVQKGGE